MKKIYYAGIDYHKNYSTVCILDAECSVVVKARTKVRNRVHRILERQPELQMPQVTDLFGKKGIAAMKKAQIPDPDCFLLEQDLRMLRTLDELVKEDEERMKQEVAEDDDLRILMSLPGVGLTIGSVLSNEIDRVERFMNAKRLCAYAGLVPTTHSSGGKTWNGRMMIGCNKWLKWAFIEAAWVAVGCDAYFGGLYRDQKARGKKANTAITIVARRMCRISWQLLDEHRTFEKQKPSSGCSHHGLTKTAVNQ